MAGRALLAGYHRDKEYDITYKEADKKNRSKYAFDKDQVPSVVIERDHIAIMTRIDIIQCNI